MSDARHDLLRAVITHLEALLAESERSHAALDVLTAADPDERREAARRYRAAEARVEGCHGSA